MKGVVLALFSFLVAPLVSLAGTAAGDFEFGNNSAAERDVASMVRVTPHESVAPGQLIVDSQSEQRGSRPIVAYTLFSFDTNFAQVSVQPVLGRINGAQVQLKW